MTASDVVKPEPMLSDDDRASIKSFDDALALLAQAGVGVTSSTEFGDGFAVMDKQEFVNVPLVILDMRVVSGDKSDYGTDFAILRVVTKDGRKGIITDGSPHGICGQVQRLQRQNVTGGVLCEKGLVVSEYDYIDPADNKKKPARTYYLYGM